MISKVYNKELFRSTAVEYNRLYNHRQPKSRSACAMKLPVVSGPSSSRSPGPRVTRLASAPAGCTRTGQLALRLQQNWLARHPADTCSSGGMSLDDSLTSLSWLQNLNILKITSPTPPPSPPPAALLDHHKLVRSVSSPSHQFSFLASQPSRSEPRLHQADSAPVFGVNVTGMEPVDYKTNPYVKPPYSYATLICMAMKETRRHKITLSAIYSWITDHFMYYRMAEPSWQNSIRHNLSLNKCFEKVPRQKDEPGKGGFWRINPNYSDMIENGIFKKRRSSRDMLPLPPSKRLKTEDSELLVAVNSIKGVKEDKLLSNGAAHFLHPDDSDDDSLTLRPDYFNWKAILHQDIDIGGVRVKTEHIIDDTDSSGPLIAMSPPSSEANSDDLGLDDLFSQTDICDLPVDCTTHHPLDLTVQGTGIRPPDWWGDSLLHDVKTEPRDEDRRSSGLHTPVPPSPRADVDDVWSNATDMDSHAAFDLDKLFDFDSIPSPHFT